MPASELDVFLQNGFDRLLDAATADIKHHVEALRESGVEFCGYAVLPPDYLSAFEPTSLVVAFTGDSDFNTENQNVRYYRHSVDEWRHYVHDGFDATNVEINALQSEFIRLTREQQHGDTQQAFVALINQAILNALKLLRDDGRFDDDPYVVIWLPDSGDEIMSRSTRELNAADVYAEFASEFV